MSMYEERERYGYLFHCDVPCEECNGLLVRGLVASWVARAGTRCRGSVSHGMQNFDQTLHKVYSWHRYVTVLKDCAFQDGEIFRRCTLKLSDDTRP
jgi:hypothetical protein